MKLLLLVLLALVALSCGSSEPAGVDGGVDVPTASPAIPVVDYGEVGPATVETAPTTTTTIVRDQGLVKETGPALTSAPDTTRTLDQWARPNATTQDSVSTAIRAAFARFGPTVEDQAVRVATCESTLRADAYNAGSVGVMQINVRFHLARIARLGFTPDEMYDPADNAAVAADIYGEQGWKPWSCRWAA